MIFSVRPSKNASRGSRGGLISIGWFSKKLCDSRAFLMQIHTLISPLLYPRCQRRHVIVRVRCIEHWLYLLAWRPGRKFPFTIDLVIVETAKNNCEIVTHNGNISFDDLISVDERTGNSTRDLAPIIIRSSHSKHTNYCNALCEWLSLYNIYIRPVEWFLFFPRVKSFCEKLSYM